MTRMNESLNAEILGRFRPQAQSTVGAAQGESEHVMHTTTLPKPRICSRVNLP